MRLFRSPGEIEPGFGPSAVTIGKFDGVHTGHRAVIDEVNRVAHELGLVSAIVTFDRNPLEVLAPERCPDALLSIEQKIDLLASTGADAALVLHFDRALADLSPEHFVRRFLIEALHAKAVLVGSDFRFGKGGAGSVDTLRELGREFGEEGFEVRLIDDVVGVTGERVSSTRVRALLAEGDVAGAAQLLGHLTSVRGAVVHGAKRGRELGFPTANLSPELEGLIPADGVYAGWFVDEGVRYPAAVSVGDNPTFEGVPQKQVEAYVIDETFDLYGHEVEIFFVERIRGMVAFEGIPALIEKIAGDVAEARRILAVG